MPTSFDRTSAQTAAQQQADAQRFAVHIQIAADSIEALRPADVYRVVEEIGPVDREDLADWLRQERPDLVAEVDEVMAELGPKDLPTATQIRFQLDHRLGDLGQEGSGLAALDAANLPTTLAAFREDGWSGDDIGALRDYIREHRPDLFPLDAGASVLTPEEIAARNEAEPHPRDRDVRSVTVAGRFSVEPEDNEWVVVDMAAVDGGQAVRWWGVPVDSTHSTRRDAVLAAEGFERVRLATFDAQGALARSRMRDAAAITGVAPPTSPVTPANAFANDLGARGFAVFDDRSYRLVPYEVHEGAGFAVEVVANGYRTTLADPIRAWTLDEAQARAIEDAFGPDAMTADKGQVSEDSDATDVGTHLVDPLDQRPLGLTMDAIATRLGYGGWTSSLTPDQIVDIERIFEAQEMGPPEYSNRLEALRDQIAAVPQADVDRRRELQQEHDRLQGRRTASYLLTGDELRAFAEAASTAALDVTDSADALAVEASSKPSVSSPAVATSINGRTESDIVDMYAHALGGVAGPYHRSFAQAILRKDAYALAFLANGLNDKGKKVFSEVTGLALPRQQGATMDALLAWAGISKESLAVHEAERAVGHAKKAHGDNANGTEETIRRLYNEGYTAYQRQADGKFWLVNHLTGKGINLSAKGGARYQKLAQAVIDLENAKGVLLAADAPAAAVVPSPVDGAQSPPVPTLSSYVPPDGWRSSLAKARDYAQALGIPSQGKDLEALTGDIAVTIDTGRAITRMDEIPAQESAKRGLEIAAIGGIGVQFVGAGEEAKRQLTAAFASIGGKVEQLRAADPAMVIEVDPTPMVDLLIPPRAEMDEAIRARVEMARELLPQVGGPDFSANRLLTEAAERGMNIERTLVVASSVAALDGETVVRRIHAAEALSYHNGQAPVIDAALVTDKMSVPTSAAPDTNGPASIDGRFAGILTGRLIGDVTASFHAQLPGWSVEVTGFDQIRASGLINSEAGAIQYEAGQYVAIGETDSGFGTIHVAPSLDVLLADIGEMARDRASLTQISNSSVSVPPTAANAAVDLIVAVREVLDQADVVLEPAGSIDDAIVRFTGAIKGAKDAPGYLGGAWHEGALEDAFSAAPSTKGIELRDTLADAFSPVRDRIRAITGDTVTLYRHNQVGPLADRDRNVLSWTLSQRVAATFAGWGGRAPQPVKDSDIETALAEYERSGRVSLAGRQYVRNEAEPAYYDILDRDGDIITDGDDLRADLLSAQADRQEMIALYQERMARVVMAEVPLSEVVWATDRAGQMEFIVRNRDEDGYRLAKDGSVRLPLGWQPPAEDGAPTEQTPPLFTETERGANAHIDARLDVLARGADDGSAHVVAFDAAGRRYDATDGDPRMVALPVGLAPALADPFENVTVHYNRVNGAGPNNADLEALALPGLSRIVLHTEAQQFHLELSSAMREWCRHTGDIERSVAVIDSLWSALQVPLRVHTKALVRQGHDEGAVQARVSHTAFAALAQSGLVLYNYTLPTEPLMDTVVLADIIRVAAIKEGLNVAHTDPGQLSVARSISGAMAELAVHHEIASGSGQSVSPSRDSESGSRGGPATAGLDRGELTGTAESELPATEFPIQPNEPLVLNVAPDVPPPLVADPAASALTSGASFAIGSQGDLAPAGQGAKVEANLAALARLKSLEASGAQATDDDRRVLARYSGWGHSPQIFDDAITTGNWTGHRARLGELLTDAEFTAARLTTLNAHYTSHEVITSIWQAAQDLGFPGGRVLEPGCGIGNFVGAMPPALSARTGVVGVELDPTTAAIARHLYPTAEVRAEGFETTKLPAASFDMAIGNVPFGKIVLHDPEHNRGGHSIHNHFILKSLALAKPGAIVAMVTSRYTMDARNIAARRDIAEQADLLGAVRLPETAFKASAGTEAVTDILFLRKRLPGEELTDQSWVGTSPLSTTGTSGGLAASAEGGQDPTTAVYINNYFIQHPDHVLGSMVVEQGMYNANTLTVKPNPGPLAEQIAGATASIVTAARNAGRTWAAIQAGASAEGPLPSAQPVAPASIKEGAFYVDDDGAIKIRENGYGIDTRVSAGDRAEVVALIALRNTVHQILDIQSRDLSGISTGEDEATPPWADAQARLNTLYDDYFARFGPINRFTPIARGVDDNGEEVFARRYPKMGGFRRDADFASVIALEVFDDEHQTSAKAAVFSRRVLNAPREIRGADDAQGALLAVLEATGRVDLPRMAELLATDQAAVISELKGAIFQDPATRAWVTADEYLSGNVRAKLRDADAAADLDASFVGNVEALRKVQPRDLAPRDIVARLGAPWIPASDVQDFVREIMEADDVSVDYAGLINAWGIRAPSKVSRSPLSRTVWGTTRRDAITLLTDALNGSPTVVYDQTRDGGRVKNPRATLDACEKREKLTEKFSTWLWQDPDRAARLAAIYNEQFNSMVLRSFDGSHLRFPGLSAAITPRQHQRNVAWRVVQDGNTLMAHAVGAGKTLGSILSSMEEKRLGLVNKPAFVVPNHMLEQFAREFKQAYPAARLLLADKDAVSPESRKAFVAKCAMGDWDAVIFTHNTFGAIPVSVAAQSAFIQQEVEELEAAIAAAKDEDDRRPTIKRLEVARKNRVERIKSLLASENKDDGLTFEQTGIDRVYVDEVHLFKNLGFVTSRPGVSAPASQRATDLFIKTEILEQKTPGRSLVGMSGTPIANRVAEMYVNQRYFDREGLVAMGISHFDAWASTFGEDVTAVELAPDGATFRLSTRFAKYNNVPELLTHFRSFTDVQTADMLNLPVPEIKGGKPQVVTIPATDLQKAYIKSIQTRMEKIRNREVEPQDDNMLKVTGDGRKAAADMRLLGFPAETTGSKADIVGAQIARIYQETKDFEFPIRSIGQVSPNRGALQLVFCDLGTPKKDGSFSMYDAIRESAIANGVPANQIRFIHDYPTDTAKARLFADCRAGRVAALFGSTDKMGVGTNVQDRLYAVHHVDCPWRPVDIEQRDGRKDRQGNLHYDLGIPTETLIYGTEGTFDVYMWQAAERKARFIGQIMKGDLEAREIEDIDGQALSYAEAKAILTGNPILMEKAGIDAEVAKLQRAARNHADEQQALRSTIATSVRVIGINEREIEMLSRLRPLVQLPSAAAPAIDHIPLVMGAFKPAAVVPRPPKVEIPQTLGEPTAEGGTPPLEGAADLAPAPDSIGLINSPGHYSAVQAAAGKALLRAVTDEWAQSRLTARGFHRSQIGHFAGLPLSLETGGTLGADTVRVCLADHPRLTIDIEAPKLGKTASGVPHIQALHRLVTGIPSDIGFYVDNIEERKTAIAQAEAALGTPFAQEALLDAKRARQSEIAAQLAIDTPIAGLDMVSDVAGDAVESEPTDEPDQPTESLDDERLTFDPRDSRSYEAGFTKGRSFFYGQVGGGIARFETTPFCRELGRAADSGNRARALGLAHAVMSAGAQYVREAAGDLSKKGYGSRDSYRGKEAGREFLAAAAATEGWGSSMSAAEIRTAEGNEQWLANFDHTMAVAEIVKPGLFADHHHVRTLMDALVQKDAFALGAINAIDGLPPSVREGRSAADIGAVIVSVVTSKIGELVDSYVKNPSSYIRDRYYDFAGATQRSVIDALPTDEDRRHYQNGHTALIAKREDIRRTYRNSNYYTMPPSIASAGAGVLDAVRAAAATLGASDVPLDTGVRTVVAMVSPETATVELSLTGLDRHQTADADIEPSETFAGRYLALVEHSTTPASILHPFPFYQEIADQLVTARVVHHIQVAGGDIGAADMAAMIEGLETLRATAAQHVMRSPDARADALAAGILEQVSAAALVTPERHSYPVYEERGEDQFAYESA